MPLICHQNESILTSCIASYEGDKINLLKVAHMNIPSITFCRYDMGLTITLYVVDTKGVECGFEIK